MEYVIEHHGRSQFDLGFVDTFIDASRLNVVKSFLAQYGVLESWNNDRAVYRIETARDPEPPRPSVGDGVSGRIVKFDLFMDGRSVSDPLSLPLFDGRMNPDREAFSDFRLGRILEFRFPDPIRLDRFVLKRRVTPKSIREEGTMRGAKLFLSGNGIRFHTVIISERAMENEPGDHVWEIPVEYSPVRAVRFLLICDPAKRFRIDEMEMFGNPM
jgi:hypothetical protein